MRLIVIKFSESSFYFISLSLPPKFCSKYYSQTPSLCALPGNRNEVLFAVLWTSNKIKFYAQPRLQQSFLTLEDHKWILYAICFLVGFLLDLFFDGDDGGDLFLRTVGWLSTEYTALYTRRQNSSQTNSSFRSWQLIVRSKYLLPLWDLRFNYTL
jgi:hypothetical protein